MENGENTWGARRVRRENKEVGRIDVILALVSDLSRRKTCLKIDQKSEIG